MGKLRQWLRRWFDKRFEKSFQAKSDFIKDEDLIKVLPRNIEKLNKTRS